MSDIRYLSGLPEGSSGCSVTLEIEAGLLKILAVSPWRWSASLPLADITGLSVDVVGKHVAVGRVLAFGIFGALAKKTDYGLGISYDAAGLSTTALLQGDRAQLDHVRQVIVAERLKVLAQHDGSKLDAGGG